MQTINVENENYHLEVLSYYLWGQTTPPSPDEIADEKWIDREEPTPLKVDLHPCRSISTFMI